MARLRRKLLWLVAIMALFLISLAGLVSFLYRDEPPPADGDLTSYRRVVPDAMNGFGAIDLGMDDVSFPDDENLLGVSEKFDVEGARKVLAENEAVLRTIEESLSFPEFQVPELTHETPSYKYLLAWRQLAYFVSCHTRLLLEEGKEREALAECVKLVRFGRRVQDAQGCAIDWLVGSAMASIALHDIVLLARRTRLTPMDLKPFIDELGRLAPKMEVLRDALRGEYVYISSHLDAPDILEVVGAPRSLSKSLGRIELFRRLLMQPNRTRRLLGEKIRALIEATSRTHAEAKSMSRPAKLGAPSLYTPGGAGKMLVGSTTLDSCLLELRVTEFEHAATRTLLAIEAFDAANGRLPASLDDLVPDYLEAVPLDPFDGKPLRWSAEKKQIHSVGEDLIDSGGSAEEKSDTAVHDRKEPTLRIEAARLAPAPGTPEKAPVE